MREMRKAAGVVMAVFIASVGLAGTASATGGLYIRTMSSFNQMYSNTFHVQTCCQTILSLSNVWSHYTANFSSYSNNHYSSFTNYAFGAISSWINQFQGRYCPPVPEPTAALAFATGLLVLSRGMRRRS